MTVENLYKKFLEFPSVSTDSRSIKSNQIFWALKGENFDGNKYIDDALNAGAPYAVSDDEKNKGKKKIIYVKDSLKALQNLANFHRNQLNIKIIAITGTNGKTTTKELIYKVLNAKYNVLATQGNFNNHIGVPLTLLSFDHKADFGIVEMGANHPEEIKALCDIAQPNYGIITNIGKAHLEGFGSFDGIINTKKELYDYLENEGITFINDDNDLLKGLIGSNKTVSYGTNKNVFCRTEFISSHPYLTIDLITDKPYRIQSQLIGKYNFENISAASCIGLYFDIDINEIKKSVEAYIPDNNRSQIIKKGNINIISDAYNANPTSMENAVKSFISIKSKNKMMILGDMFELGKYSEEEHDKLIVLLHKIVNNDPHMKVLLVGKEFCLSYSKKNISESIRSFRTNEDLIKYIIKMKLNVSWILIKGSRGMKLEELIIHL